jgi:hypothetical protein
VDDGKLAGAKGIKGPEDAEFAGVVGGGIAKSGELYSHAVSYVSRVGISYDGRVS